MKTSKSKKGLTRINNMSESKWTDHYKELRYGPRENAQKLKRRRKLLKWD
jgi:hypothetical protein